MWFKKKAYISGYNSNTAVDNTDWRTNGNTDSWSVSQTLPSAAEAGNYFYLPALGYYLPGMLFNVGRTANYWSSSAYPWKSDCAYYLGFLSTFIRVAYYERSNGYRIEPTCE